MVRTQLVRTRRRTWAGSYDWASAAWAGTCRNTVLASTMVSSTPPTKGSILPTPSGGQKNRPSTVRPSTNIGSPTTSEVRLWCATS